MGKLRAWANPGGEAQPDAGPEAQPEPDPDTTGMNEAELAEMARLDALLTGAAEPLRDAFGGAVAPVADGVKPGGLPLAGPAQHAVSSGRAASTQTKHERADGPPRPREIAANSLLEQSRAQQRGTLIRRRIQDELRAQMRERMLPQNSGLEPTELERPTEKVKAAVRLVATQTVKAWREAELVRGGAMLSDTDSQSLVQYLFDCQFGEGALQPLLDDPTTEEVMLNSAVENGELVIHTWVIRVGVKTLTDVSISPDEVIEIANRNGALQDRTLNASTPILNCRMRSGARMNAVLDPACTPAVSMTIRVHRLVARTFDDLVRLGTLTRGAANFIHACVHSGISIIVAGGTASGKTNLLNAIARIMPSHLRVVSIEDTPELDLAVPDKVSLVTVNGRISQRELVATSLRMRPDRIVIGEVRDAAAWDAIKATNTGHPGTLLTIHAESAHSVPLRLLQLTAEAPEVANMPEKRIFETIASAFQVIVFIERDSLVNCGVKRQVACICQLTGAIADGHAQIVDLYAMQDGALSRTPARPSRELIERFRRAGLAEDTLLRRMEGEVKAWT